MGSGANFFDGAGTLPKYIGGSSGPHYPMVQLTSEFRCTRHAKSKAFLVEESALKQPWERTLPGSTQQRKNASGAPPGARDRGCESPRVQWIH